MCSTSASINPSCFSAFGHKNVEVRFESDHLTSDAGMLFLREADIALQLTRHMDMAILDSRERGKVKHTNLSMLTARIFAIASGYFGANDIKCLRGDAGMQIACGKLNSAEMASQPTISRFENGITSKDLLCLAIAIGRITVSQLPADTKRVVIDIDATDDPCYGNQQMSMFNRYYDSKCYLPLLLHITADDKVQWLMASLLRPGNAGAQVGLRAILGLASRILRERFPNIKIELRADGAYGNSKTIAICKKLNIDFTLGMPGNSVLQRLITEDTTSLNEAYEQTKEDQTKFCVVHYHPDQWPKGIKVIAKLETCWKNPNTRYVITTNTSLTAEEIYHHYSRRGDQENRIKELKNDLSSGSTSCSNFKANQFRLLLHTAACVLMRKLQSALKGTRWAQIQIRNLRLRIIKMAARIQVTRRKVTIILSADTSNRDIWDALCRNLGPPLSG